MTHPITPPPELINQWWDEAHQTAKYDEPIGLLVATRSAQWGADQELEACREWLKKELYTLAADGIRAARRPKPSSLKERLSKAIVDGDEREALKLLEELDDSL
jgi:hypothetical protein